MNRNATIDNIRSVAMIAMILIHTSYYFITDKTAWFLWNWSQFAVPAFIFCSGYVFFLKKYTWDKQKLLVFLKKRFLRLYIPYIIFAVFFLPILYFVSSKQLTLTYIEQSLFLTGGIDINWLVLLMLELCLAFVLLSIIRRNKILMFLYVILSLFIAVPPIFNFSLFTFNYKLVMWLPWSLIGVISIAFLNPKTKKYLWIFFCPLFLFILSYLIETFFKHDTSFINNKYPPNILILSYGFTVISGLYWLSEKGVFKKVETFFYFISIHSYSMYFIHYCLLIFLASFLSRLHLNWYSFFLVIFLSTLCVQYIYNSLQKTLFKPAS